MTNKVETPINYDPTRINELLDKIDKLPSAKSLQESIEALKFDIEKLSELIPKIPSDIGASSKFHEHKKVDVTDFSHAHSISDIDGLPKPTPEISGTFFAIYTDGDVYEFRPIHIDANN